MIYTSQINTDLHVRFVPAATIQQSHTAMNLSSPPSEQREFAPSRIIKASKLVNEGKHLLLAELLKDIDADK
jgi:hypothetical protein